MLLQERLDGHSTDAVPLLLEVILTRGAEPEDEGASALIIHDRVLEECRGPVLELAPFDPGSEHPSPKSRGRRAVEKDVLEVN